jgi:hypothetical protein
MIKNAEQCRQTECFGQAPLAQMDGEHKTYHNDQTHRPLFIVSPLSHIYRRFGYATIFHIERDSPSVLRAHLIDTAPSKNLIPRS